MSKTKEKKPAAKAPFQEVAPDSGQVGTAGRVYSVQSPSQKRGDD